MTLVGTLTHKEKGRKFTIYSVSYVRIDIAAMLARRYSYSIAMQIWISLL